MLLDYLEKNLALLSAHKGTFDFVKKFIPYYSSNNYLVEEAKNGQATLKVKDSQGRFVSYHSKYHPNRESQQLIDSCYKGESHIVLLGFGMGYEAEVLLQLMPDKNYGPQLFIVEPDPFVFISALKYRDLSKILSDKRVVFYIETNADSIGEAWNSSLDWSVLDALGIIEHQPSKSRFNEFFTKLLEKMKYLANRSRGNLITLMHVGSEFHTNNFMNLPEAFGLPGVERLFDKFKNLPVIIVAAGPSLDKNLEELKRVKGRFPIIAVDTAYRHMLAKGIKPDIVCAADSSYENSLDFVGVEDETQVILVTELMTHPDIFKVFKGPKMISTFGGGLYPQIRQFREPIGQLICWGSVATMAFDLARSMGANPIIFIGFDLSFCDGRLHTKGSYSEDILFEGLHPFTSMENATAEYICQRGKYQFIGDGGEVIYTDTNMKAYKGWFEDQFRQTEAEVINATEGGIVDKFVTKMTLKEAIEKYFDKSCSVNNLLSEQINSAVEADYNGLYENFESRRKLILGFKEEVEEALPLIQKLRQQYNDVPIDQLRGANSPEMAFIMDLHDRICQKPEIVQWFAALHTKFVTKHTGLVVNLRNKAKVASGQWLDVVEKLFETYEEFANYQLPILENALFEVKQKNVIIKYS